MKLNKIILLICFAFCVFSCGKNDEKEDSTTEIETKLPTEQNEVVKSDSIKDVKKSILRTKTYKKKEVKVSNDPVSLNNNPATDNTTAKVSVTAKSIDDNNSFVYLKKILNDCKVGQTLTQKELSTNLNIPKDAIKLVKSIEKISDNEIDIKWKSSWLIEAISDAKLKDGILKMNFKNGKMYTSGKAIGIKYDDDMYYDLVITGHIARIPNVKGYYWQIGKD